MKKEQKGITLIVLAIIIVILLILAGITIGILLFSNNGIVNQVQDATNVSKDAEDDTQQGSQNLLDQINSQIVWRQSKTTVTNGTVILKVGQEVTGYTVNSVGDGNWCVLGAENGKLLITTKSNQGNNITLGETWPDSVIDEEISATIAKAQNDYETGVDILNEAGMAYSDGNMAESARSMKVEDINRVTGYDPDVAQYNSEYITIYQWKNKVTYTVTEDGVYYKGTKYPTNTTSGYVEDLGLLESNCKNFIYLDGNTWKSLANGESKEIENTSYYYYPQTLSTDSSQSSEAKIKDIDDSEDAYNLLFTNGDGTKKTYWLASQEVYTTTGGCCFGLRYVISPGYVSGCNIFNSDGSAFSFTNGLRPVVSLKSNVKVTSDGALSV